MDTGSPNGPIQALSAITLASADMPASVAFYETLGFEALHGGEASAFTSFRVGDSFLNVQLDADHAPVPFVWGRVIVHVDDVDAMHRRAVDAGFEPETEPADAPWGERYFHLRDPDGHELSFARPLS